MFPIGHLPELILLASDRFQVLSHTSDDDTTDPTVGLVAFVRGGPSITPKESFAFTPSKILSWAGTILLPKVTNLDAIKQRPFFLVVIDTVHHTKYNG
jgi:hypothetical protein